MSNFLELEESQTDAILSSDDFLIVSRPFFQMKKHF